MSVVGHKHKKRVAIHIGIDWICIARDNVGCRMLTPKCYDAEVSFLHVGLIDLEAYANFS